MVSDRNRQIIERRHSGESFSAIGTALGISRERVRQFGTPNFTPDDVAALEYSVAMFSTIPNFGLQDWKGGWSVQENRRRFNAAAAVNISMILGKETHQWLMARSHFEAQSLPLRDGGRTH